MKNIAVIGSMLTGNKGAASMMISLLKNMEKIGYENCDVNCLTIFYEEDKKFNFYKNLELVSCSPYRLVFVAMPLSILYLLFCWISPIKKLLIKNRVLKTIYYSDLVVNIAGICYSDGRGPVLIYNIACDLIPIMMKKRIFKFSQAIGPFKHFFNRISARMILPKITKIAARGDMTVNHLKTLTLDNYELCPDGAFSLPIEKTHVTNETNDICEKLKSSEKIKIGVAPSSVVEKYCSKINVSYTTLMADFIHKIASNNKFEVVLFPYSGIQNRKTKKNNDLFTCREIYEKAGAHNEIIYIGNERSAEDLNYLISTFNILVTSRYHAMIISLSTGVIPVIIGWSHKYTETLNQFDIMDLCISYSSLSLNVLESKFASVVNNRDSYKNKIVSRLPEIKEKSFRNFIIIKEFLETN